MCKNWFENYKELAIHTRWISIFGASILALFMIAEIIGMILALISSEAIFFQRIRWMGFQDLFPLLILLLLAVRVSAFSEKGGSYYRFASMAWIIIAIVISTLLTFEVLAELTKLPEPECVSTPEKICFSFYDMRSTPVSPLATLVYVICGFIKFGATGLVVLFRSQTNLK